MVPSCLLAIICSPLHVTEHEGKKDVLGLLVSLLLLSVVQSISVYTGATRSASKRSRKNLWPPLNHVKTKPVSSTVQWLEACPAEEYTLST